jgi:hypothetical protein
MTSSTAAATAAAISADAIDAIDARWKLLSDFVRKTCVGRDDSHGHAHMKAVAEISRCIVEQDFNDEESAGHRLMVDAITAAWLHDIAGILERA